MTTKSPSMADHALRYAAAGLPVIPLHGVLKDGRCTCGLERCASPGKHPRTKHGLREATTDERKIRQWWGPNRWPNASIGGVCGAFLCLDIDARAGGFESLDLLVQSNTPLPDTAVVETGLYGETRGRHYWFAVPEDVHPATRSGVRPGIDVRCTNGYAVMPPSPHASGVTYDWVGGLGVEDAADCPEWLYDLVPEHVAGESAWAPNPSFRMSKDIRDFLAGTKPPAVGEQRETLLQAARSVLTTGRSVEQTAELLWEGWDGTGGICAAEWGDDPWTEEMIYAIVSDIYAKPPSSPMEKDFQTDHYELDDFGNAARLIASFPDREHVHYVPEQDRWYIWDTAKERFMADSGPWMRLRWAEVTEVMLKQAANAGSEDRARALANHAIKSRYKPRVDAVEKFARDLVITPSDNLDPDPFLFAVQNGVVDLRSGELYVPEPRNMLTRFSPAVYNPEVRSATWDRFLERVVPDEDLRDFLQMAVGYSLTGSVDEHKFFFLYGPPASGKSTFLDAVSRVVGTYGMTADPSTFMRGQHTRSGSGPSEDLARLAGARMVVTHEIEEGERFAEALISKFTSGDKVAARYLHARTFEFRPQFKLWIGANHRARVAGSERSGIWRRMLIVPMDVVIPVEERDPTLNRRLRQPEVTSAVLTWAVEGAQKWIDLNSRGEAMEIPVSISDEVTDYKHESSPVYQFVEDALTITEDERDRVAKKDLYRFYQGWCESEGRRGVMSSQRFSRQLTDMGLATKKARTDGRVQNCWIGVKIKGMNIGPRQQS